MATPSNSLNALLDNLRSPDWEGTIPYMYVDTAGKVTVGVGHNLTDNNDLSSIKFYVRRLFRKKTGSGDAGTPIFQTPHHVRLHQVATDQEKRNDYAFLAKHVGLGQYAPHQLGLYTTVEMEKAEIDRVFVKDRDRAIATAKRQVGPVFDTLHVSAQAALVDIAFNTGSLSGFPTMLAAIRGEGAYAKQSLSSRLGTAKSHSARGKVKAVRNNAVAAWFDEAIKVALASEGKQSSVPPTVKKPALTYPVLNPNPPQGPVYIR